MKRLAIFVEGYSELLLIDKLAGEYFSANKLLVTHQKVRGRTNVPITISILKAAGVDNGQNYYLLIMDCGNDREVKARIFEQAASLASNGYELIIGLRDFGPEYIGATDADAKNKIYSLVDRLPLPVVFILAKMGIEAWYLAETSHFERLDPALTLGRIHADLGIDLTVYDCASLLKPHDTLKSIYDLENLGLDKPWETTVSALDYLSFYSEISKKIPELRELFETMDNFANI